MIKCEETISAISTAPGVGGVAVIRMSGRDPLAIAEKMFRPAGKTEVRRFEPYKMYVGEILGDSFTDFGMCVYFKSPMSYTGEDVVELHCHGGVAITRGILKKTFELGARPATRGEFTRRAFVNGKMSLSSCEGLIDMINSESVAEVKAGYYLYREKLTDEIKALQERLTYVLAFIDAGIDYPEEGVVEDNIDEILTVTSGVKDAVDRIVARYGEGRVIKNGASVAIIGKPNTGKSSLLNRLLDYDKAIVSGVAGTTRDVVDGEIDIEGVRFNFKDTAGIRLSDDEIEKVGIDRARRESRASDICVVVIDGSEPLTDEDREILRMTDGMTRITVANKSDLYHEPSFGCDVAISAKTGEGVDKLKKMLFDAVCGGKIDIGGEFLTEERHYVALKNASDRLSDALRFGKEKAVEIVAFDIKSAWDDLGEVSGETATEAIVDEIFSKFCVGK